MDVLHGLHRRILVLMNRTHRIRVFESTHPGETITQWHIQRIHMSTTIRISDETKSKLRVLKEDGESWDEFLNRLARQDRDVDELGGFADDDIVDGMETARQNARDDWDERTER